MPVHAGVYQQSPYSLHTSNRIQQDITSILHTFFADNICYIVDTMLSRSASIVKQPAKPRNIAHRYSQ